ncbi:MAG: DEAD/DEAH box helicase [Bacteroides sp.]|nr:DEAD/DEAH box helicase [Bacteroides sp.]MCM1378616.1 DEAD/DEAH box helicase [Bacteroides sp.]MCM1444917.1 DEAD/DEAH box helicase [Prevotella sp.]
MNTKDVIRSAKERLHIEQLTPMQHKLAGLSDKESAVALIAPTGSGKTLAFALALLPRVAGNSDKVEGLVIAPTRELTLQITKTLAALAPGLRIVALYGGHSVVDETRSLEAVTPDIVVGTPGRILDHINRGRLDLYRVKILVCDEYDKSLELGFQDEMKRIVKKIHSVKQIILTSATRLNALPDWLGIENLTTIDFSETGQPKIEEYSVNSPVADKLETLKSLLLSLPQERTMVFVNHRESAERVYQYLKKQNFPVILYHGALDQHDREMAVDLFTNGTTPIMVATDLAARGLDIPQVESVVHYHLPSSAETRTHRNGRAARMGAEGRVYYILAPTESGQWAENSGQWTVDSGQLPDTHCPLPAVHSLYFHEGKKEKLSKGDIVGALTGPGGLAASQIGIIALHDHRAIVAVKEVNPIELAQRLNASRIKGRRIRVTPIKL